MLYREIIAVCSEINTKHINTLCGQNVELYIKTQFVPRSKHSPSRLIKTYQFVLYREIIAVCSEINTKHINTLCGQKVEFLGALAKLRKATVSFVNVCLSVYRPSFRPHGATRYPLDGFSLNLMFEYFSKVCRKKIRFH